VSVVEGQLLKKGPPEAGFSFEAILRLRASRYAQDDKALARVPVGSVDGIEEHVSGETGDAVVEGVDVVFEGERN
jgi:hypothetical protein